MRHNKKFNHLGRKAAHRDAMLANMACSLIMHKRISTTLPKAKALRVYVEPLITKSKAANDAVVTPVSKTVEVKRKDGSVEKVERQLKLNSSTAARRTVFRYLKNKEAVTELFGEIAPRVAQRPGGYTRILRTGFRLGDNAEMCIIELVDYNENMLKDTSAKKSTRTRRSRKSSSTATGAAKSEKTAEPKAEKNVKSEDEQAPVVEEVVAEAPVVEESTAEEKPAEE